MNGPKDLRAWIELLRREGELVEITQEVDSHLEITEIADRVLKGGGPALAVVALPLALLLPGAPAAAAATAAAAAAAAAALWGGNAPAQVRTDSLTIYNH